MTSWPQRPVIYEINTAVWLDELSRQAGRNVTLADITAADWAAATPDGVDAVWLMGVWERSPAGLALARANLELMNSFRDALPDVKPEDVFGSPYCVRRYVVDEAFGGREGLAAARAALAARGARLVLDYVPNHVAPDHPWLQDRPEVFVHGEPGDLDADPAGWMQVGEHVVAHGRDPYFPPWPDVVQLNAFADATRAATVEALTAIADQCDAIRCDMAMLMINDVFARTWGDRAGPKPSDEFWPSVIAQLRVPHPETILIAEAYWDMEWELQQQGFDFCYDKRLYDRILDLDAGAVRGHLGADPGYQARLLRFLENHDEPPDSELDGWYRRLLATIAEHDVRSGDWQLLETTGWPDNQSSRNLLAWSWSGADHGHVIVVNLSDQPAQGRVRLNWPDLVGASHRLRDLLHDTAFDRVGAELTDPGLYVGLEPWQSHVFALGSDPAG